MKNIKSILIIAVLFFSLGCVQPPPQVATPTPTATLINETPPPPVTPTPTPELTPTPTPVPREAITYKVWIDSDRGFYMIRVLKDTKPVELPLNFNVLNFTINTSDMVIWINDDSYNFPLTVVSNEGLWTPRPAGYLRGQYDQFRYTFNQTGNYTFSIKEYPRIKNQTIIVNP